MVRSSKMTAALIEQRLFDQSIVGVFPYDAKWIKYLLGFFNSSVCTELIKIINPSANNSANYIKKIPFIVPKEAVKVNVEKIVDEILLRLKEGEPLPIDLTDEIDQIFDAIYKDPKAGNEFSTRMEVSQLVLEGFV